MTISNIANTAAASPLAALNSKLGATGGQTTLGQADFLNLITTQLQNQDPLQPMDNSQFIAQMASFSSLQQMQTLTQDFQTFNRNAGNATAGSYLGKQVTVSDGNGGNVSGIVTGVDFTGSTPQVTVNGTNYDLSAITNVTLSQPTAGGAGA